MKQKKVRTSSTTTNKEEIAKFNALANEWWDLKGGFRLLHKMNPVRIAFIRSVVEKVCDLPIEQLSFLDIGSGGGLVSLPISRLGASVLGIDMSYENVRVATTKAKQEHLRATFQHSAVEDLNDMQFDVVLALEVLEHVENAQLFLESVAEACKPGGVVIISSINSTIKSRFLAKIAAEYIFRIVPIGTHDVRKFISPEDVTALMQDKVFRIVQSSGLSLNPITENWKLVDDMAVNYICAYQKN